MLSQAVQALCEIEAKRNLDPKIAAKMGEYAEALKAEDEDLYLSVADAEYEDEQPAVEPYSGLDANEEPNGESSDEPKDQE